jgi:hypothetical protein
MNAVHRITGYDKRSERLALEYAIPDERLSEVRELARVPREDADAAGSYPLDPEAASIVGLKIDKPLNVDAYDWFLEPFAGA